MNNRIYNPFRLKFNLSLSAVGYEIIQQKIIIDDWTNIKMK